MRLPTCWIAIGLAALACAGRQGPALCVLDRAAGAGRPDADTWIALLLRGYDARSRRVTSPPIDCTGAQVRWEGPALRCDDTRAASTLLPDRPVTAGDVLATPVSPDTTLVWIATTRYATGDASGPVALVSDAGSQLRVLALGALRAYPQGGRLRLEDLGTTKVLVADGDSCAGGDRDRCVRASRVVPLRGDRFAPAPLVGQQGQCLSPAWFELARRERRRVRWGWERTEFAASMSFVAGRLLVEEQLAVHDVPDGGDEHSSVFHRAQSTREVRWDRDRLVGSGTPLWSRVAHGEEP